MILLRIGVFGGTFNPPHIGHEGSAKAAVRQLGLDRLYVIPAGIPPHKAIPSGTPPAEMRLDMTIAAFSGVPNAIVSDIEIKKIEPSYTVDTIQTIKKEFPAAGLYLLMGTDMFLSLETWRESETLLRAVTPVVFPRCNNDFSEIEDYSNVLMSRYGVKSIMIENEITDISSSALRDMLPMREGSRYITDTTYSYIIRNRLYGAKPDWDWLREKAHSMLNPARIPHVDGCEQEALSLAERWGVDINDAREAAILHDITKKLTLDENIEILGEPGIKARMLENNEEKLLHSHTGAILAKTEFGVSEQVAGAIMWHTTGRAGMTSLEKIIYLADYIEPKREFEGVEELRALAYENLDAAMKKGLEMSVADMKARGIIPNRTTFDALDDLQA